MKQKLFLILLIILEALGLYKEVKAEEVINGEDVIYTVHIYGDFIEEGTFFEGYVMYEAFNVENQKYIKIKGSVDSEVEVSLSNIYLDKGDDRYYSRDKDTPESCGTINGDFSKILVNKGYKYMYFMRYISIDEFDGMTITSHRESSIKISNFVFETIDKPFIINYKEHINTYGNLYDVNDFSSFEFYSEHPYYIKVYKDNYTNNYKVNGEYEVVYKIYDDYSNEDFFTLNITVLYDEAYTPTIRCDGLKEKYDVLNKPLFEDLKKCFSAYDSVDKDITNNIVYETNYRYYYIVENEYYIDATIINSRGYGATIRVKFKTADITPPTISKSQIRTTYHDILSEEDIIKKIDIKDYSPYTYEVISDSYTKSFDVLGVYTYQILVKDTLLNSKTYDISIEVYDDIKPEIITKNIKTTTASKLTDTEILNSVIINEKNKYSVEIDKSQYEEKYNEIGVYKVFLKVTDISGNEETAALEISVVSEANIKYYSNSIVIVNDHSLSEAELITFLRDISDNTYNDDMISVVESNYFKTPLVAGVYEVTMTTKDSKGLEYIETYSIEVKEKDVSAIKVKKSGMDKVLSSISGFFKLIISFFISIFKFMF